MDTAIAIRTAVVKDNKLFVQAGAGIVADSIPRLEWKETINKARSLFQAAAMAENGLVSAITAENPRIFNKNEDVLDQSEEQSNDVLDAKGERQ